MGLQEFFQKYFVNPIKYNQGYNIVNTLIYALVLSFFVFLLYRMLRKMEIDVDENFFRALLPYIILGPLMRAMTDNGLLPRTYLTVSPGAYFVIATFAVLSLYIVWRNCRENLTPMYEGVGWILFAGLVFFFIINWSKVSMHWKVLEYFLPFLLLAEAFIYLLNLKVEVVKNNRLLFYIHFYDATTTFVAIQFFGFWEQHVLARTLMGIFHTPAVMYLEKLLILLPVVWALDNLMKEEDPNLINFVKLVIFILGFGPGTRNLLDMLMGG